MSFVPNKPLIGREIHQPLVNLAAFFNPSSDRELDLRSAQVQHIFSSNSPHEAVMFLTQHKVSLAASLEHLGLSYEDLKNSVTVPGLQRSTVDSIPLIKSVRALTGWGLAPAVWILKLLAMANIFFSDPIPPQDKAAQLSKVAEAEVEAFRSRMLALGFTVEVTFTPVN